MPVIVADTFRRIKLYDNSRTEEYDVVADDRNDTLTLEAGVGISLVVNPENDSIVIYNTGNPVGIANIDDILEVGNTSWRSLEVGGLLVQDYQQDNVTKLAALTYSGHGIQAQTNKDITLKVTGYGTVVVDGTTALRLPLGTTNQRPGTVSGTVAIGQIRFNTEEVRFEGYDGRGWNTLGGVSSIDGGTVIAPDANAPILNFKANGSLVATMSSLNTTIFSPGLVIPVGTTAERPPAQVGQIRFNSQNTQFEGYNGQGWSSLGGVRDIDGNTYIVPELEAGSNENTLYFVTNANLAATLDGSRLTLENGRVLAFREGITGGNSTASIAPPDNILNSYTLKLPTQLGAPGSVISVDATGQLSFVNSDSSAGSKINVSELYGDDANDGFSRPVRTLKRALQIASGYVYSPTFVYNEDVCRRDAGLIIDGFGWDLVTGSNWRSIKAGLTYYNATASTVLTSQKTQTVSSVRFLKSKVENIVTGTPKTTLSSLADEVINILDNGTNAASAVSMPAPADLADQRYEYAKVLLLANKDFLVAETIAWINEQINTNTAPFDKGFSYNETKCRRDTGLILDAVAYDLALGTNYNAVTNGIAYQRAATAYLQSAQKTVTVEAIQYLKTRVLALTEVSSDSTATSRVNTAFLEIIDIIQNGVIGTTNSANPLSFTIPTGVNINLSRATSLLVANREFLRDEIIAWLNLNYPSLVYNQATCSRDIGLFVDAMCYDILYGGDSASLQATSAYFSGVGAQVLPTNQRAATIAAFNKLSAIAQQVILHETVTTTIGNASSQDISGIAATSAEATKISTLVDYVTSAINDNTLGFLPTPTLPSITWADSALQAANTAIIAAKTSLTNDTIDNINSSNPFIYDSTKCARDTEFMVYSVAYDLIYGGNSQTRDAGLKYYSGVNNSVVISGQTTQSAASIDHLRTVAISIIQNIIVTPTVGNTETQITNSQSAGSTVISEMSTLFTSISSIITGGINAAPTLVEPTLTQDPVLAAIKTSLQSAKARIADNVIAYASAYKPNGKKIVVQVAAGNYIEDNPVIIPDNTSVLGASLRACDIRPLNANQDMFRMRNGAYFGEFTFRDYVNEQGVPTHTFDYATVFDDPTDITCDRLGYTNMPISKPIIFVSPYIQNVSILSFLGGNGAKVDGSLVETPNIPDVKELTEYPLSGPVPEQGKSFVANAYTMLSFGGTGWRLLNDAYAQIVSCFQIFMLNGSYAQSGGYLSVTNSATNFGIYALRSSGYSKNAFTFDKGYIAETGTSNSKQTLTALGFGRAPNQDYVIRFRNPDYKVAYDLLEANKVAIQDATVAWIQDQIDGNISPFSNGFTYNQSTCARDVGLIIDALGYDLMFGSNFRSVKAAMSYYRAQASTVVGVQKEATVAAFTYLKGLVAAAAAGSSVAVSRVNANMNTIIDIVNNGLGAVPAFTLTDPTGYDTGFYNARRLLTANRSFIVDEVSSWILAQIASNTSPFNGFVYNGTGRTKCERDVGYIVDAIRYDLTYGGNLETVDAAMAYYSFGTFMEPGQKTQALAVQAHIKSIIGNIVTASTSWSKSTSLTQDVSGTAGSGDASTFVQARIQEVYDTINTDGTMPTVITPSLSWVATSLVSAKTRLQDAKVATQTSVISWINTNYPSTPFTYNTGICYRDVGLIIDAVATDIFTGGNSRSIEAGKSYYIGTTSANVVVDDQKAETIAAINYAKGLAQSVVASLSGISTLVGNKFDIVTGAIADPAGIPVSVAFGSSGDITNSFKPSALSITFDASTDVDPDLDTIYIPLHGFINGQAIIYESNDNREIPGLNTEQTYYVYFVDSNNIKLTFDEGGTAPVNIRGVGTGTHLFFKNLQDFFVDDIIESHNTYQELTLQAGSYVFTPGAQITGVTAAATNNAYVYSYDPVHYKLVVSLNKVTVGSSIIRNTFAAGSTIDSDNGSPSINFNIPVTDVQAINTLYSATMTIQSTTTGGLLTNLGALPGKQLWLHRPSIVNSSGHTWEYAGSGIDYNALPQNGGKSNYKYEQFSDLPGRVYTSGTNELGDFKVGDFIKAENKTGNVSFTNKVSVAQLDALRLAVGDIVIDYISADPDLGDNEPGGSSNSRLTTQKAIRSFLSNRLGGFIDKSVSTNAVPGAIIQLNSSGQINPDLLPAVRTFNSAKAYGYNSRLTLLEEVPAYDFLNGDIVTEEYSSVQLTLSAPITVSQGTLVTQDLTGATGYIISDLINEAVVTIASRSLNAYSGASFNAGFNTSNYLVIDGNVVTSNTISTTGTVGSVTGTGPWTATLSGLAGTAGLYVGATISATNGTGKLYGGTPTSCVVASISSTSITFTVTGGTAPTNGTITNLKASVRPALVGLIASNVPANYVLSNANEGQYLKLLSTGTYSFTNGAFITSTNDNVQGNITSTRYGVISTVDNATITPGSGYTPASGTVTYSWVSLTNVTGSGTGGIADITVTNGSVTSVDMRRGGTGYAVGDQLSASTPSLGGTGSGFKVTVTGIEKRAYVSLIGGERFVATLASPNFIADNNAPVQNITASGSSTKTFNAASIGGSVDYTNSRITISSHGYTNGDPVKYVSSPNTAIGGLDNDAVYYVFVYDSSTIELYKDYSLNTKKVFTSSSTGTHSLTIYNFNLVDNSVYYAGHPYNTGDPIRMTGSSLPVVGVDPIVTGSFFFAGSVTPNSFTLHAARSEALASVDGLVINKTAFVSTGSGTITLTKQNVIVQGVVNTSSTNKANWSPLSATTIDASSITGGVISTSRLAGSGTANDTTYLRGDSTWHTAVQSIREENSPITLTGSYTTSNSKDYYYNDVLIDIERVDSNAGDSTYTNLGVAKFRKSQFQVGTSTSVGEVFIKDGVVDAGTLDGLDSAYFLNPANLTSNVPVTRGGTNLSSYAVGDMLYASTTSILSKVAIGPSNAVLTSDGTKPVWRSTLNVDGSLTIGSNADTALIVTTGGASIGGSVSVGKNINLTGDLNVTGNVNVAGAITTINSTTVNVDDKNIELGSVSSITGLSGTISGSTIAGLLSTSGLSAGMKLIKTTGVGAFGLNPVINTIVNGTTITITSSTANTDGTITFDILGATNATADGGGITVKGDTDKTWNWVNATSAWTSSEHINISAGKEYRIGGIKVMDSTSLGSGIVSIGTITTGVWNASIVGPTYGGTGINNGSKTITLGGSLTTSGAYDSTFTMTNTTSVTFPTSGTLATLDNTETLTNKTLKTSKIRDNGNDHDYILLVSNLAADRNITLPLLAGDDTFVFEAHTQTLSNKTLTTPKINDSASNNTYNIAVSDLAANRTITLPLLGSDDTFVFESHSQTLSNKTLTTPKINNADSSFTYNFVGGAITANRNVTLPALTGNDTFAFIGQAQTLTNKTLTDASTYFQDEADNTKKLQFQLSGITSGVTRTLTVPDQSGTISVVGDSFYIGTTQIANNRASAAQSLTGINGFTSGGSMTIQVLAMPTVNVAGYTGTIAGSNTKGTGTGGQITIRGGAASVNESSVGAGGAVSISGGAGSRNSDTNGNYLGVGGNGGNVTISGGTTDNGGSPATLTLVGGTGAGGAANSSLSGASAGNVANTAGGNLAFYGGQGTGTGAGGSVEIYTAPAGASGSTTNGFSKRLEVLSTGQVKASANITSTSTTSGTLVVTGGVGISENVWIGGTLKVNSNNVVTVGDTGTVTNAMLAGSIANSKLTNSSVTVGTTAISLGSASTTLAGLTSVTSTGFTGDLTGTVTKTVTGTNSAEILRGNMADNDQFRILIGGTASNAGYVEIATADDGTEPIYVRQYTGVFTTLARTATLLDASGDTSFPGTLTATTFSGSGSSLTSLPAGQLTGTIPSGVLGNSTVYIGTTGIALNRASATLSLTGVNIDGSAGSATTATTATYLNSAQSASDKDDITTRTNSGFWQTSTATTAEGWPETSNTWAHLISSTHSNGANYYAMQFAGSFYNSNSIYYRSTNGSGTTAWNRMWHSGNFKAGSNVSISDNGDGTFNINSSYVDTNTITTVGANTDAGVSGDVKLVAGSNVTITRSGQNITINSSYTDTNTWQANTKTQDGYVTAPGDIANKVWKTDALGNPGWRDDADTDTNTVTALGTDGSTFVTGNVTFSGGGDTTVSRSGNTITISSSTTAVYAADLAERYQADAEYAPGTVLMFGGEFEVTVADDDTIRVAGIVSTDPAYLMNKGLNGPNTVAIALQGRVPCKVKGKIRKGDMLVAAGGGYARATDNPKLGAIIGKALENFDGDEGVIEVVVGRM